MDKTSIVSKTKQVKGDNFLECEVYYEKGGFNHFSGKEEKRGIRISVVPYVQQEGRWRKYSPQAGNSFKILLKETKRKSAKENSYAGEWFDAVADDILDAVIKGNMDEVFAITKTYGNAIEEISKKEVA